MIRFDEWIEVSELESLVELENQRFRDNKQVWGNKGRAFREAWVASKAASHLGASHVKVFSNDRLGPDFCIRVNTFELSFQSVEVLNTWRTRGDESWWEEHETIHSSMAEMDHEIEDIPDALDRSIRPKIGKYEKKFMGLLIYLNISTFQRRATEVNSWIFEKTAICLNEFTCVYILLSDRFIQRTETGLVDISTTSPRCRRG
jgi:hypothetical protein